MKARRALAGLFIIGGMTTMAMAAWTSPWGTLHNNDSTCGTEKCARACRVCCSHFNTDADDNSNCRSRNACGSLPNACKAPIAPVPFPS